MVYIYSRLYDRASLFFFFFFAHFLMHICLLIIIFSSFFFSLYQYTYIERQCINAENILYCILMVTTPTILFVELSSRGINQSERNRCYPFAICVGEKKRKREEKNQDNTKKRERERWRETKIYVYIQAICLSDSGSPSAKGNKTNLCGITVCLCAKKILFW